MCYTEAFNPRWRLTATQSVPPHRIVFRSADYVSFRIDLTPPTHSQRRNTAESVGRRAVSTTARGSTVVDPSGYAIRGDSLPLRSAAQEIGGSKSAPNSSVTRRQSPALRRG